MMGTGYNVTTEAGWERLMNTVHRDPDQSAAPAGGVCLWNPQHASYDVCIPAPDGKLLRLWSYVYHRGRRVRLSE